MAAGYQNGEDFNRSPSIARPGAGSSVVVYFSPVRPEFASVEGDPAGYPCQSGGQSVETNEYPVVVLLRTPETSIVIYAVHPGDTL